MKTATIFGTRPEMIKMWGVLKKLDDSNQEHIMIHTGQNFTKELKDFFFRDLKLRKPDYYLDIDTSSFGNEVSDIIKKTDELFDSLKLDNLLILGDTYSGLSILPAKNQNIKVFHMEAGLRAWDKRMPEQRNRILIDHMSDILLPFNKYHRENLIRENIHPSKIFCTGNTVFEPMRFFSKQINESKILNKLKLKKRNYILVTCHRSENVDNPIVLKNILSSLATLGKKIKTEVIFPMHPRTYSKCKSYISESKIKIIHPLGFYDYNKLSKDALCILSDSGTACEEGLFYKVPNVVLRTSTERPETLESGGTIVSGLDEKKIIEACLFAINNTIKTDYDFSENKSPSSVVMNSLQSDVRTYF